MPAANSAFDPPRARSWPASHLFQTHVARPIVWEGRMIILQAWIQPESIRRSELLGIRIEARDNGEILIREGLNSGPVWGLPGDQLELTPEQIRVNGQTFPRPPGEPAAGRIRLPADTWHVWPALTAQVRGVELSTVNQVYDDMAQVSRRNLLGRPFSHWFFRPQTLP